MKKHLRYNPFFWLIWIASVLGGFSVFYNPFWGSILVFFLDFINGHIACLIFKLNRSDYYKLDKIVDWINLTCMLLASIGMNSFFPLLGFFLYRLIGYLIYLRTHKEWLYIIFPNLFDFVFFWYVIQYKFGGSTSLSSLLTVMPVIFILKESQEIFNYVIFPKIGSFNVFTLWGKKEKYFGNNPL